jgi:hypothetical protein
MSSASFCAANASIMSVSRAYLNGQSHISEAGGWGSTLWRAQWHVQITITGEHVLLNLDKGVQERVREVAILADHFDDTVNGLLHDLWRHSIGTLQALGQHGNRSGVIVIGIPDAVPGGQVAQVKIRNTLVLGTELVAWPA